MILLVEWNVSQNGGEVSRSRGNNHLSDCYLQIIIEAGICVVGSSLAITFPKHKKIDIEGLI